jgi:hypothetical protein
MVPNPTCTSGSKAPNPGTVVIRVGTCADVMASSSAGAGGSVFESTMPLLDGEDSISLRVLPDRSVADFFVQGGRYAGAVSWPNPLPRHAPDSTVTAWATLGEGIVADVDAWSMGCGWVDPSYTDQPSM